MPTKRGFSLLALAAAFYLGGRLFGTYELYLLALSLTVFLAAGWLWTLLSGRKAVVEVRVDPPTAVAGDSLEVRVGVRNGSLLPLMGCEVVVSLRASGAEDVVVESPLVLPRRTWTTAHLSQPVWRGVYELEQPVYVLTDPLGLAQVKRRVEARPQVVVVPRIARVEGFNAAAGRLLGIGDLGGRGSRGGGEFRSIRPHQPGEPLSRIHWPSTARLNALMLRELEDAPRANGMVVLDGWQGAVVGEYPTDTFEKQVELVGALADGVLRKGRPVMVLAHGAHDLFLNLEPIPADRQRLLQALAGVTASAVQPVGEAIARAMTYGARVLSVAVVSAGHDPGLAASLQHLVRSRVGVVLVHVSAASYLGLARPTEEENRFLLRVQSLGVPIVIVGKDDDPGAVLSAQGRFATTGNDMEMAG